MTACDMMGEPDPSCRGLGKDNMEYDESEATAILSAALGESDKYDGGRRAAARKLLGAFSACAARTGYHSDHDDGVATVSINAAGEPLIHLKADKYGWIRIAATRDVDHGELIPLVFNPRTGVFFGRERDTFREPAAGGVRQPRSALAVIADEVVKLLYTT